MNFIKLILDLFIFFIFIVVINACASKNLKLEKVKINYISVKLYGAKGDGIHNDVNSIQNAFNNEENVFFPKGKYLINSAFEGKHNSQSLLITDKTKIKNIRFEHGAELYIKEDFFFGSIKNSIIKVLTKSGNISQLNIDGLKIYAENISYSREHTGIFAIEEDGYEIKNLVINNASFYNLSGSGLITYAKKTTLNNIYTENTALHGIGAMNPYNLGKEHYIFIQDYTSFYDRGYSVDFGGTEDENNRSLADPEDKWTGIAKNIQSFYSRRGIKTAGHWNLYLENIHIKNPEIYGFFINKDSPGRKIKFKDLIIENSGDAGISLNGVTEFEGTNLQLINCKNGAIIQKPIVNIEGLIIDGQKMAKKGLRFHSCGVISDFQITGINDDYSVWISGKQATLKNGIIYNNDSSCGLIIHDSVEESLIENVYFYDDRKLPKQNKDILILQKAGSLRINNTSTGKNSKFINKLNIDNRSGIKIDYLY